MDTQQNRETVENSPDTETQVSIIDEMLLRARSHYFLDAEMSYSLTRQVIDNWGANQKNPQILKRIAEAHRGIAAYFRNNSQYDHAMEHCLKSLAIAQQINDKFEEISTLDMIAVVHGLMGNYSKALEIAYKAVSIAKQIHAPQHEGISLNTIGYTLFFMHDYARALTYLTESIKVLESLPSADESYAVIWSLSSLCEVYLSQGNLVEASLVIRRVLVMAARKKDRYTFIDTCLLLSVIFTKQGKYTQAVTLLKKCLARVESTSFNNLFLKAYEHLGTNLFLLHNFEQALQFQNKALAIATSINSLLSLQTVHGAIAETYVALDDHRKALHHLKQVDMITQKIFNEKSDMNIKVMNITYTVEKAKKDAELLHLKNIELQTEIDKKIMAQQELKIMAISDSLTGIYNRRHLFTLAEKYLVRAQRYNQFFFSVLIVDLDHFKIINDTYGHLIGDSVICAVAKILKDSLGPDDTVGRYGGEEFGMLLLYKDKNEALAFAGTLCMLIHQNHISTQSGDVSVSVSIGISDSRSLKPSQNLQELFEQADKALYQAKNQGRDQCCLYNEELFNH